MSKSSNQDLVMSWIKEATGNSDYVAVPLLFLQKFDAVTAIILTRCIYLSDKNKSSNGLFYKSAQEWEAELGITYYQVKRAVKNLEGIIITTTKKAYGTPTMHFRVDFDALQTWIEQYAEKQSPQPKIKEIENQKQRISKINDSEDSQETINIINIQTENKSAQKRTQQARESPVYLGDEDDLTLVQPPDSSDLSWIRHPLRPLARRFLDTAGEVYFPTTQSERRLWYRELTAWSKMGATPEDIERTIRTMRSEKLTIGGVQSITKTLRSALAERQNYTDPVLAMGYTPVS